MKLALLIALALTASATLSAQALRAVERVTIDELKSMMAAKNVVILDVRTESEFKSGRIPGAININYVDIMGQAERFAKVNNE